MTKSLDMSGQYLPSKHLSDSPKHIERTKQLVMSINLEESCNTPVAYPDFNRKMEWFFCLMIFYTEKLIQMVSLQLII